jgi:S1-C subfamily serine protease
MPIIKTLETVTTTAFIAPGNSGSSVFNMDGEIVALVFAGYGRGYSQGILVPYSHVRAFLEQEFRTIKWIKASNTEIYGRTTAAKKGSIGTSTVGTLNIRDIKIFPSIVSQELDATYIKLLQCEADKVCSLKR